jgi:protease I
VPADEFAREDYYDHMSKRILILTGDGGEGYEALYAVHRFAEAGWTPVVAAPSARRLHLVMHDFEPGWDTYIERQGYGLDAGLAISDARAEDYEALLIPGGRAPEFLRNDKRVIALVKRFAELNKWIFALCHGIQVLVAADLVRGRRVTCYEHVRFEVQQAGGLYETSQAFRDGKIVTGQTWQSHPEFYREIFACLAEVSATRAARS